MAMFFLGIARELRQPRGFTLGRLIMIDDEAGRRRGARSIADVDGVNGFNLAPVVTAGAAGQHHGLPPMGRQL